MQHTPKHEKLTCVFHLPKLHQHKAVSLQVCQSPQGSRPPHSTANNLEWTPVFKSLGQCHHRAGLTGWLFFLNPILPVSAHFLLSCSFLYSCIQGYSKLKISPTVFMQIVKYFLPASPPPPPQPGPWRRACLPRHVCFTSPQGRGKEQGHQHPWPLPGVLLNRKWFLPKTDSTTHFPLIAIHTCIYMFFFNSLKLYWSLP